MIRTILFDLDGTLLPMDNERFTKGHIQGLIAKLASVGYDPKMLEEQIWRCIAAVMKNDGTCLNMDRFWQTLSALNPSVWQPEHREILNSYYTNEFCVLKTYTGENPMVKPLLDALKAEGFGLVLATNPLYPRAAIETRLSWIGLTCTDFDLVTTYENMHYCKPNPKYYGEIVEKMGKKPEECLMVGNNPDRDCAAAAAAGLHTILVSKSSVNESDVPDAPPYKTTNFADLLNVIRRTVKETI